MRGGSDFIFESVELLSYHLHEISLNRSKSYIKSPKLLENKRGTINPQNNDDKYFQYAITVALNHQNIENYPERISNIEPFINIRKILKHAKKVKKTVKSKKKKNNNKTIDQKNLNKIMRQSLLIYYLYHAILKQGLHTNQNNCKRENQVVLLMITDDKNGIILL